MQKVILTCSCNNMDKKAKTAFELMFPGEPMPEIIRGRDRIYRLAQEKSNEHLKAISKLSGRYAYYIEMDGDKIIKEINLTTGVRVG